MLCESRGAVRHYARRIKKHFGSCQTLQGERKQPPSVSPWRAVAPPVLNGGGNDGNPDAACRIIFAQDLLALPVRSIARRTCSVKGKNPIRRQPHILKTRPGSDPRTCARRTMMEAEMGQKKLSGTGDNLCGGTARVVAAPKSYTHTHTHTMCVYMCERASNVIAARPCGDSIGVLLLLLLRSTDEAWPKSCSQLRGTMPLPGAAAHPPDVMDVPAPPCLGSEICLRSGMAVHHRIGNG